MSEVVHLLKERTRVPGPPVIISPVGFAAMVITI